MTAAPVKIAYFSDILCIWAYIHEVRMRALLHHFAEQVTISYHFMPLFASAHHKIQTGWADRGGFQGYGAHVYNTAQRYEHIHVDSRVWAEVAPRSSASVHNFIKALQLLEQAGEISAERQAAYKHRTPVEEAIWRLRLAFFHDARDISLRDTQLEIADSLGFSGEKIMALIHSGESLASFFLDLQLKDEMRVQGSPTLVLNQGRQILYGNVGYRVLEANIQELLTESGEQASWC
ncbi:disulfide bond formation protein DsbA [bacterium (Candidatus Blackallbacteria) CG17_big_fil_post_rev_8_21_14_2_50_48_46]|uniref:Disulfide bond formation protein DsbA n=1 Tax=bacterium (Candidatus Blackallbacteria) CG17_big_fil_post_rev_8_21_14_2_50_48_46 TaxID=2014261 RepID=A0A2M7G2L6_9BACT|nr:MAG: disulfide bond formation protein DsbA [bacterium (Candidatus Blackallbacteria) CG18_big_fil_WC_8_21_14_2_50_49_26]PIW15883.1 MAG: disulfide bond formation protein DsbA [bacterium (Candidatus Blackallbacteria) CG17_big_fil_post_rev_8_21_14_2_50_48_46]PIW48652.1 MAG: disulfide bond formation protein DsbA [bacterium (Candidatus Blackallbacteria) CG13_big_fil_rev_8_21_14_2_50_49_14]